MNVWVVNVLQSNFPIIILILLNGFHKFQRSRGLISCEAGDSNNITDKTKLIPASTQTEPFGDCFLTPWIRPTLYPATLNQQALLNFSVIPGPRIPPGACQPIFMFARSLQKRVFCDKFRNHWFDGVPFRISTTYMVGSFTNIGYL